MIQHNKQCKCFIWDTEATGIYSVNDDSWVVNSVRSAGRYEITGEVVNYVEKLSLWEKARLTTWLIEQRKKGDPSPKVSVSVICSAVENEEMKHSDRINCLLDYLHNIEDTESNVRDWMGQNGSHHRLEMMARTESVFLLDLFILINKVKKSGLVDDALRVTLSGKENLSEENNQSLIGSKVEKRSAMSMGLN
ncbi:MAG: hypothetical protein ABW146_09740 [Candidatus Sedimenticola sp. 6PFRAG7]